MTAQESKAGERLIKSCASCGHVRICAIFRAVSPLLAQSWDDDTRPIQPDSLANICKEYVSASAIQILNE